MATDFNEQFLEQFKVVAREVAGQLRREEIRIAVVHESGHVQMLAFGTKIWAQDGTLVFEREATPEAITANVRDLHALHSDAFGPVVGWRTVRQDEVPPEEVLDVTGSRVFRNALRDNGGKLEHDLDHARELALDYTRSLRQPQLEALSKRFDRAMGQKMAAEARGDADAALEQMQIALEIEAQRQSLRDMPDTLDLSSAATTQEIARSVADAFDKVDAAIDAVATASDAASAKVSAALRVTKGAML